jgi:DNA adenine methylase
MDAQETRAVAPLVKWAGGKRWAVPRLLDTFPKAFNRYYEPFFGSGAAFFAIKPSRAVISDANEELMTTYRAIKDSWQHVWQHLEDHARRHSSQYYYDVRAKRPKGKVQIAARFLYLNRTCWNGLYRVNRRGIFNVPKGSKETVLLSTDAPSEVANALKRATILTGDFEKIIDTARAHDLVYADPPYSVNHNKNGFLKYNESIFTWADQERLAACIGRARERGVFVVVSNANHKSIRALYGSGFALRTVYRSSVISSASESRGRASELVIVGQLC